MYNRHSYNGLSNTIGYDSDLRPASITVPGVESLSFAYDAANRITGITNGMNNGLSQGLGYDALDRLTSVTLGNGGGTARYAYDADGNRVSQTSTSGVVTNFAYASTSNQLASVSGGMSATYGYNADGDTKTIDGHVAYTYGPFNSLVNADGAGFMVSAEGQRLEKTSAAGTTYFAPDASGPLLAEDLNGTWRDYVWLNGRLVTVVANGGVFSLHDDQTGRPLYLTDPNSHAIDWAADGWPFDRDTVTNSWGAFEVGFPGQYWDTDDNLWHNGARDYDPQTGRYIESDPIGLAGGVNTYAYVGNDPLSFTDPLGLSCSMFDGVVHAVASFFAGHINQTLTFDAGVGVGAEGSVTATEGSNGIEIGGRVGIGLGIGVGVSATGNYTAGHTEGWDVEASNTGGVGGAYVASVSGDAHGNAAGSVGIGIGLGEGASATVGYDGAIATVPFPKTSGAKTSGACGCGK